MCRFGTWSNNTCSGGTQIGWETDNLPIQITAPNGSSTFSYGPDKQRYAQTATDASGAVTNTTYIGSLFEVVSNGTTTLYRHNISAYGQVVAVHTIDQSGNVNTDYLHTDHLGSLDTIIDPTGAIALNGQGQQEVMSFDAFGVRRDPANWAYDLTPAQVAGLKDVTDRGYTFQEELDNVGLIHMNGRVYDPSVASFISADPVMGGDRYAYVGDNPLSVTDPTGYCWAGCFWQPSRQWDDAKTIVVDAWHFVTHPAKVLEYGAPGLGNWVNIRFSHSATLQQDMGEVTLAVSVVLTCTGVGAPLAAAVYAGYEAYITDLNGGSGLQIAGVAVLSYMKAYETDVQFSGYYNQAVSSYDSFENSGGFSGLMNKLTSSGSGSGSSSISNIFNNIYQKVTASAATGGGGGGAGGGESFLQKLEDKAETYIAKYTTRSYIEDKVRSRVESYIEGKLQTMVVNEVSRRTNISTGDLNTAAGFDYSGWYKNLLFPNPDPAQDFGIL